MRFFQVFVVVLFIICVRANNERLHGQAPQNAKKGQFPFYVELRVTQTESEFYDCGGTLIHPKWILTAAQCFKREHMTPSTMFEQNLVRAYMGSERGVEHLNDTNFIIRYIKEAYLHSNYAYDSKGDTFNQGARLLNDISVAVLKQPFDLNRYVKTIKLPSPKTHLCSKGTIIGTGQYMLLVDDPLFKPYWVRYASIYIKPVDKLAGKPPVSRETAFYGEMLNTKLDELAIGTYGDQGTPYVCNTSLGFIQYGVFSGFYTTRLPSRNYFYHPIYESVDKHRKFIMSHVPLQTYHNKWRMKKKHKLSEKHQEQRANSMQKEPISAYLLIIVIPYIA